MKNQYTNDTTLLRSRLKSTGQIKVKIRIEIVSTKSKLHEIEYISQKEINELQ